MKSLLSLVALVIVMTGCEKPKPAYDVKKEEAAVRAVIEASQIAWNNGDLEAFMASYWNSDSLQFVSKRGFDHGWKETLEGYKEGYPDRASMGTLHFEIISVTPMNETHFVVQGKYQVTRVGSTLEGVFTLIFKKIKGSWVAIYDHTC
ncbi:MAG: nuclear transport factor 2 family protein [Cyclobacteriaceae bacterium]|nr:nuclear transport factor 2 family protein [Cyclobacteriaceae bacterium]